MGTIQLLKTRRERN